MPARMGKRALKRADASLKEDSSAADGSGDDVEAGVVHTLLPEPGLQSPDAAASSDAGQRGKDSSWPYSPPSLRNKDAWQGPPSPHSDNSDPWGTDEELRQWAPAMQEDSMRSPTPSSRAGSREIEAVHRQQ
ncbi:hypothetical protein COCSUDRAFT_61492 [Coccomyxa subellipsoidea C-169]|uniref:Uncharacterized protein n=1 Tax=Coccomyxa subellipsoidea (strain C-169) TaxID=574566 RepID=I0Z3P3_COCSC|nr:hypothetical protein COCSUDRAFT_61492 [Coccomyxa subellipsoidea C-169]EIE25262.1 hypothetical protein COCSUDRAFT_61492 [Coccomyxa subellipsoidea C-169]|eukprot:XP_005649806.1 hypothetical protein COCSUDRAFT_61492 [Coccomyxa subellipsoidea C-169]